MLGINFATRQFNDFIYLQTTRLLHAVYPALDAGLAMTALATFYGFIRTSQSGRGRKNWGIIPKWVKKAKILSLMTMKN